MTANKSRKNALLCSLLLLACVCASYPVAEMGMVDDWSYVKTCRVLADTGHIVYNGWATAMLGWQLYLGAAFVKLFGPSYTSIRASTLLVAMATAYLAHRAMVRAGVNDGNATVGTLLLVLSPLALPLEFSFMTDIGGLFFIVLCFYACLRALQAESDGAVRAWLALAALSNAFGGASRQIAWLSVLVMFPCAVWLLRRRPLVVALGASLYVASAIFIFGALRWFARQPYSVPEPILPGHWNSHDLASLFIQPCAVACNSALFLLPVLLAFVPTISFRNRRVTDFLILGGVLCLIVGFYLALKHPYTFTALIAPYGGNYVATVGLIDGNPIKGTRPLILTTGMQALLTAIVLFALDCFFAFLRFSKAPQNTELAPTGVSWKSLLTLTVPFLLAYGALLMPRGMVYSLFDRYLLPLIFFALILLLRLYQDRIQPQLPAFSIVLTAIFTLYAIAGTHDAFALFRTRVAAIAELKAAGIPDKAIDGGYDYNAMTQIEQVGYINDPRIRVPRAVFVRQPSPFPANCIPDGGARTPVLVPGFALSLDPAACGGASQFTPVSFRNWLGWRVVTVYIVRTFPTPIQEVRAKP